MNRRACNSYALSFWLGSPLFAICLPTAYIASLYLFKIVEPVNPLVSPDSVVYCFGGLVLMAIAAYLGMRSEMMYPASPETHQLTKLEYRVNIRSFRLVFLFAVVGFTLNAADLLLGSESISALDFVTMRDAMSNRQATLLAYPGNLFYPFCIILLGICLLYFEHLPRFLRVFGIVFSLLAVATCSLMLAGRSELVNLLILTYWWLTQRPGMGVSFLPKSKVLKLFIVLMALFLVSMLFILAILRSAASDKQVASLLNFHANTVSLTPWVQELMEDQNPFISNGIGEICLYWSHSVVYFDKLYSDWTLPPTFFTAFSSFLDRRFSSFGLTPDFDERWNAWQTIMQSYGYYPNAFGTTWSQMIISLGKTFGMFTAVLVAYYSGKIFVQARHSGEFRKHFISSILFLFFFLWFQPSIFINPVFEWGMLIALVKPRFLNGVVFTLQKESYDKQ